MADTYVVEYTKQGTDGQYDPAPAGLQQVVCVDGIMLGEKVEQFGTQPAKIVRKYALVYQTLDTNPATGRRYEIQKEFTISMHEKAALRKFLGDWRGKKYTDEEAARVELHKVVGVNGLATVEHRTSQAGRTYGVITNITPLMKGMDRIQPSGYERAPYWEDRKQQYAADVAAYHRAQANGAPTGQGLSAGIVNQPGKIEDALKQAERDSAPVASALDAVFDGESNELPF